MIMSIDAENAFDKMQHPFIIKTLSKLAIDGTSSTWYRISTKKPIDNIILNCERLKRLDTFP